MHWKYYWVVFALFFCQSLVAQTREVCFTVDDLPTVPYGIEDPDYQRDITERLLAAFDRYRIPAIGFVNESKLYRKGTLDSTRMHLLALWLQHGYELGNHTFSHLSYHQASLAQYGQDILKGELVTRPLAEKYGQPLKYFRHPYLRIGRTRAHHDSLQLFLAQHHYQEAPVTIDNEDYVFAKAYHNARVQQDSLTMQRIGQAYIRYQEAKINYYEQASEHLEDRNVKHILLLHANRLNADYMEELAEMYQQRQYTFISLEEALTDEAYQQEITRYGDWGISWIERWALSRGNADFLRDDPPTPDYIVKLSGLE